MVKLTTDDIDDLKVLITGDLVLSGHVKDCTDTDDETEFEVQEVIFQALYKRFVELNILKD